MGKNNIEIRSLKSWMRWPSRLALVLLSCAIASAQNSVSFQNDGVSDGVSSAPGGSTSAPSQAQKRQAAAKPGNVIGTVLDQTGSVAAGVVVRVTSEDSSFSEERVSGDNGQFSFSNVPPG